MSDALMALANQNTAPKEAAVWQPLPSLKAVDNKGFVRVQDGTGQTSHFTRWSYKHLDKAPKVATTQDSTPQPAHETQTVHAQATAPADGDLQDEDLQAIKQLAYERGVAEGRQRQLAEQNSELQALQADTQAEQCQQTQTLLENIQASIEGLHEQPALRYEPLKRLAVHLAEQLVLAELSMSTNGIKRLIERCLDTLDVPAATQVVVDLNPDDLALLQSRLPEDVPTSWRLQANPELMPGSVRVTADDAVVTDLVEERLSALAAKVLQEPQRWQAQTLFEPQRLQTRGQSAMVQDAMPKPAFGAMERPEHQTEDIADDGPATTDPASDAAMNNIEATDHSDAPPVSEGEDHAD